MGVATTYQELERLCHLLDRPIPRRPTPRSPYQRADLFMVGAATRGSITGAMAAAHSEAREEALRNLQRDQYANNTRNTRDSRWNLWTRLAQQWGLPPVPITTDLVNAIGASLKQGRYRSAPQVFSMARQQHVTLVKQPLSMDIELLIKQTVRSIERGLGSPTLKDHLILDPLSPIGSTTPTTAPWPPSFAAGGCYGASKWQPPNGNTFGSKPHHSKTDTIGMCITRSHPCMCADGLAHLRPYRTLQQYIIRTTTQRGTVGTEESFLFPGTVPHSPWLPHGDGAAHWSVGQRCGEALRAGHTADMRNRILISQDHRQPHSYTEGGPGHGEEVPRGHLGQVLD